MPNDVTWRTLGFLSHPGYSANQAGGGALKVARYEPGGVAYTDTVTNSLMRPVSTAAKFGTGESIWVYLKRENGVYFQDSDLGRICYRKSMDNGVTVSGEVCLAGPAALAYGNGLTVTYSARGNIFVVGYLGSMNHVYLAAVPAAGNTSSANTVDTGYRSWHAPAVACREDAADPAGCHMVHEDFTNAGCAATSAFGATSIPFTYTFTFISPAGWTSPCVALFDTPGLAYSPAENVYEMAVTSWSDTIRAYRQSASSLSWTSDGDIWNVPGSYVLSAVLSFRNGGVSPRFQSWFVSYAP